MSEYHAAVALANLDAWPETRTHHMRISEHYRNSIEQLGELFLQPGYGAGWVSSTTNVILPFASAARICEELLRSGIETRTWWGQGCHLQPAFADCPRSPLPVTEHLGSRVLGLPHFPGMEESEIDEVVEALSASLR